MDKNFDHWNKRKIILDQSRRLPSFKEREVWWCSIGMNIGFEIYGKGGQYTRPVLVLSKYSRYTFFGLPLGTSRKHNHPYYLPFEFNNREGSILLAQGRIFDSKRLAEKIGKISEKKFAYIKTAFKDSL